MINTGSESIAWNRVTKKNQEGAADDPSFEKVQEVIQYYVRA
jgi:hypothetical protein